MIKPHFTHVDTMLLFGFNCCLPKTMFSFCILLASAYTWTFKIYGVFCRYLYRKEDGVVPEDSTVFLSRGLFEKEGLDLLESRKDEDEAVKETECSVFLQSKCHQFVSSENMIEYFVEEPKTVEFVVEEMFVGSDEVLVSSDGSFDCEREDLLEQKLEENLLDDFDEESSSSFRFSLFNASLPTNEVMVYEEREKLSSVQDEEIMEEQDFSYEVELLRVESETPFLEENEPENWMSDFLDRNIEQCPEILDDSDEDDYIELELLYDKESTSYKDEELLQKQDIIMQSQAAITTSSSDSEDEEDDVLSKHEGLVQQMKMELKNCSRIRGLPTISEECETPKIAEDLKPLQIDRKIEFKDVIDEIHKFYKCYTEKMRKLDILNYQTLHAISFLQLKESEVSTACKKKADLMPSILPKLWTRKVQRIYADPMHKSISEMHCDLELIYVGQLCLSWEIICWLYVKGQELLDYDSQVNNRSYNRAAEEFQQFQVLMQRFIEDEPFQGHRKNQNYVKSRCMIRNLLHVPIIKDDCFKAKKERKEETDAISLRRLVEIIKESMMIFREFIFTDKKATNVVLKGIHQGPQNSQLLVDIVSKLQKKERRIRERIRSQNCIVRKIMKNQEECRKDSEILTSEVELRLVYRVLNVSRLTRDHLVWCQEKLDNINFVGKKVRVDTSFLLFPC